MGNYFLFKGGEMGKEQSVSVQWQKTQEVDTSLWLHSKGFDTFVRGLNLLLSGGAGSLCWAALWLDVGLRFARFRLDLAGRGCQGLPLHFGRLFGPGGGVAIRAALLQSSPGLNLLDPLHGSLEQLPASLLVPAGTPVQLHEPNWTQEVKRVSMLNIEVAQRKNRLFLFSNSCAVLPAWSLLLSCNTESVCIWFCSIETMGRIYFMYIILTKLNKNSNLVCEWVNERPLLYRDGASKALHKCSPFTIDFMLCLS